MTGQLGRVLVGGRDRGAGFALGSHLVVTANHVVRDRMDQPVVYVPTGSEPIGVERMEPDPRHDVAILWLRGDVEFMPTSVAVRGAGWRVESPPPGGNDPPLHGTVTTARMTIQNASGLPVEVMQLEVDEQLGDFGGYSGSAVLDSLGRTVLALLVEQRPVRTPVTLGERRAATNVLYAVPIGDVIAANGLLVRAARPLRFDVGLLSPGMVARPGLLDEAVGRVIGAMGGETGAGLVVLRGPGGLGKTVLARQIAEDVRVWAEFIDGIVLRRAGQDATADSVARQLQEALGCKDRDLAEVLNSQRLLLIVDDVWDEELLGTLQASLPPTVVMLATTRGVSARGAVVVRVGAVGRDEAIAILARGASRSGELDRALGGLAETLFHWPLLLTLAAAEIHRDDELDWGFGDEDDPRLEAAEPGVLIGRAKILQGEFPCDPTMLDELKRASEAAPRSVEVLVRRSLDWLGPESQMYFQLLAIYPPGAVVTPAMLEDLWQTSPRVTRKQIKLFARVGLAQPVREAWSDRVMIELHDLIAAWLHHKCGRPTDACHEPIHGRLAGLCILSDGDPGKLTQDRAKWLVYHLVSAGTWNKLKALPTLKWRSAFLVATGSDATFLAGLDRYGQAALAHAPDAIYHAVRAWLFAAHVRVLIGQLPTPMLVAMAIVGDPIAAITQAGQHPSAGKAVPTVLAAVTDRLGIRVIEHAVAVAGAIPEGSERGEALAGVVGQLAGAEPRDAVVTQRAMILAETIPHEWQRGKALASIAQHLADAEPANPVLIERAVAVAGAIRDDWERGGALAAVAGRLARAEPGDPAVVERALAVAEAIPNRQRRSEALAAVSEGLASANPADTALLERALAVAETIPEDRERSRAVTAIAKRLADVDPAEVAVLTDRALTMARASPHSWERSEALAAVSEGLVSSDPADPAVIERALAIAGTIPGQDRGWALAGIAWRLAGTDSVYPTLLERVLTATEKIPYNPGRDWALAGIANGLASADPGDPALTDRALAVAGTISHKWQRGEALIGIAWRLAGADPGDRALVDRALAVAETIPHDRQRGEALAVIAGLLAPIDSAQTSALIDQAVAIADNIPDLERSGTLAGIAEELANAARTTPALLARALAVAGTIPDDPQRSDELAALAERLIRADLVDPALLRQALGVAETITDPLCSWALAGIAKRLADADPRDPVMIEQALEVAETIPHDRQRGEALAAIAGLLTLNDLDRAAAVLGQAITLARAITDDERRNWALAGIAKRLAEADPRDPAVIEQALEVAENIPGDVQHDDALSAIIWRLADANPRDPAVIDRALEVAETISDDRRRSEVLASIAGHLAEFDPIQTADLIERALAVAEAARDDWVRSDALAAIARGLAAADLRNLALIDRALAVVETVPDDEERADAIVSIAEALAGAARATPALLELALAVAETVPDWQLSRALAGIARELADTAFGDQAVIDRALAVAETIPSDVERRDMVARIHALTTSGVLDELSHWQFQPLRTLMELLEVFLENTHDKSIVKKVGLAILEVTREFPAKM